MAFTRQELREILGEAHTDEIATKLVNLHRSVLDPIKDQLDGANRAMEKYKKEAEKVPDLQEKLREYEKEDFKAKYEKEHADFEGYKTKVAQDAETAKVKAAYRKLLAEEKVSEKTFDSILAVTDYSKMKLKEDGTLDAAEDLKKDIDARWGSFKVSTRKRGENVDNPPRETDNGGGDTSIRDRMAAMHAKRYGALPTSNVTPTK